MAHELEIVDGKASMLYVGETPWHGLGVPLKDPPSIDEAICLAGLNWEVETRPLFLADGREVPNQATVRTSDNKVLGVVGPEYTVLQNAKAFEFFQPLVEAGDASLETAGSLRGGSRVWVLARTKTDPAEIVSGDEVRQYILLSNSHDGTLACSAGFTRIRTVCANTLAAALGDKASKLIKIRHTTNIEKALELVRAAMVTATGEFQTTVESYRALAAKGCSEADLRKYVTLVFAPKRSVRIELLAEGANTDEAVKAALDEARKEQDDEGAARIFPKVQALFEGGKGANIAGVRGTYWGAYNAVTEYLGYMRGKDQDRRLDNLWFGDAANLNKRALSAALAA